MTKDSHVTERDALDQLIQAGGDVPVEVLKAALTGEWPLTEKARRPYAEALLRHALDTRDAEAAALVAALMDADPMLDAELASSLNIALTDQPDAVYAFVRAHLNDNLDKRWLRRLKMGALFSLRVAINDADTETIVNWLTLIAREPGSYDLGDVLHYGILAAQERALHDPELARQLVLLAARRDPASLDTLLDDQGLIDALPNNVGRMLRDQSGDPLSLLQNRGPEIFLVAMARAARARAGTIFTPANVSKIWELYLGEQPMTALPPHYRPESIVSEWVTQGVEFLSQETLQALVGRMLTSERDDLLLQMFHQPKAANALLPLLVAALEQAGRTINEALDLIGRLVAAGDVTSQQAAEIIVIMLAGQAWSKEALPLAQHLARLTQQYPALTLPPEVLWNLLTLAGEGKEETIARKVIKRLVLTLEAIENETELADSLKRMMSQVRWSETASQHIIEWWRGFIRGQSLNRLQRLDKALEGRRSLETERDTLGTLIALRKMLGGDSLQEFSQAVRAAFTVLEALSESFDPNAKRPVNIDPLMLRHELDARSDALPPEERQVLANNLKELAQIIGAMGDSRTKANLMRREDDLDRNLMSGEQAPHSAVDAMKWLAGYWGSTGEKEE